MRKNLLVLTKAYQWLVQPFLYLYGKYWGEPLTCYTDQPMDVDLPDWCEWRRVPCYSEGSWPWQFWWGNGILSILAEVDEPMVSLFLPDYWVGMPVPLNQINAVARYMLKCGNIIKTNLQLDTYLDQYGQFRESYQGLEFTYVTPGCIHCGLEAGTALGVALWDREKLAKLLQPHWSPWGLEKLGTERMLQEFKDWVAIGTRPALVKRVNAVNQSMPTAVVLKGLAKEDQEIVRQWIPARYEIIT